MSGRPCAVEPFAGPSIAARDDEGIVPIDDRLLGHLDLSRHVVGRDHSLKGGVAALLGKLLVLDLDGRHSGGFVAAHGMMDIEQAAVPGIGNAALHVRARLAIRSSICV